MDDTTELDEIAEAGVFAVAHDVAVSLLLGENPAVVAARFGIDRGAVCRLAAFVPAGPVGSAPSF